MIGSNSSRLSSTTLAPLLSSPERADTSSSRSSFSQPSRPSRPPQSSQPLSLRSRSRALPDSSRPFSPGPRYGPTATLLSSSSNSGESFSYPPSASTPRSRPTTPTPAAGSLLGVGIGTSAGAGFSQPPFDAELDDELHTFTEADKRTLHAPFEITSWRGWANALTLLVLGLGMVVLFLVYPILTFTDGELFSGSTTSGYNLGGINGTGQYPSLAGFPTMIDEDTPESAYTRTGFDGGNWNLVFSDEFNKDGRTFYPGDDPFFTAVDLFYWTTTDFEWYDPSAVTTKDGHLLITVTQETIHDLNFKSGMLQSWNQLCFFKNAYVEFSVSFPGNNEVGGFWPGGWMMGNLGRPGYGATTDGMWPYSYSSCDVGILPNQTWLNGTGPEAALTTGANGGTLSYLPGMRASACTCPDEDHPGPSHNVGRSAVEIDIIEEQLVLSKSQGQVSQSYQIGPYDDYYLAGNTSSDATIYDSSITSYNSYKGGLYQQSVSALTMFDAEAYWGTSKEFRTFGMEYQTDLENDSNGYITWASQGEKSWTLLPSAMGPNSRVGIGQRLIAQEPMALVFNLGLSNGFQTVDFEHLTFPNYFRIDYVRVYQTGDGTVGCDPAERPTSAYIKKYTEIYNNPNMSSWESAGYATTKNQMTGC